MSTQHRRDGLDSAEPNGRRLLSDRRTEDVRAPFESAWLRQHAANHLHCSSVSLVIFPESLLSSWRAFSSLAENWQSGGQSGTQPT